GGTSFLYPGAPSPATELACGSAPLPLPVPGGQTYYFMVNAPSAPGSPLSFPTRRSSDLAPANDLVENATVIGALPFSATQGVQDATKSVSDPSVTCTIVIAGTMWFRYDAPASGLVRVSATASGSPGVTLFMYQGTRSTAT